MIHPDASTHNAARMPIGFWMCVPVAVLQAFNAGRAALDPQGFAMYLGAPLAAPGDASWVLIYGLRAAFIALFVAALLARRDLNALKWAALAALILPLGDAWVARQAGAETSNIVRHAAIAAYLVLTTIALFAAPTARAK